MKRLIPLFLVMLLCVSLLGVTAFAADGLTFTVSSATAARGEEVVVTVDIANNPGVAGMQLSVAYDTTRLEKVTYVGTGMGGGSWVTIGEPIWLGSGSDSTYNGQILTLTFKVKDDAPEGDAEIKLTALVSNQAEQQVAAGVVNGKVTVPHTHSWATEWSHDETGHWFACSSCAEKEGSAAHTFGAWVEDEAATCGKDGTQHRTCSVCSYIENGTIPATGNHSYTWEKADDDLHKGICACGDIKTEAHNLGEWITDTAATCGKDGTKHRECTVCDHVESGTIPATGNHSYTWEKADDDLHKGTCACGDTKTEAHDLGEWITDTAATCGKDGTKHRSCSKCDHTENGTIPSTGEHNYVTIEQIEDDQENHKVSCSCGEFKTEAHTWKPGKVTKPATCGTDGEQPYSCECGAAKTEGIPATGEHDYTDDYKDNEDGKTHTAYCACDAEKTEDHDFSINGKVTVEPTKNTEGKQEMLCVCGAKIEKTLSKISADLDDVPKTGDITPHIMMGVLTVISLFTAAAFIFKRKLAK